MKYRYTVLACVILVAAVAAGCHKGNKTARMIAHVDALPPEERPAEWERTKALMLREAPQVGEPAPDFTAKRMKGSDTITLSEFHPGQPKVLIFGSYT